VRSSCTQSKENEQVRRFLGAFRKFTANRYGGRREKRGTEKWGKVLLVRCRGAVPR